MQTMQMQLRTRQPSISGTNKISSYGTQSWCQSSQVRNKTSMGYQQPEKCGRKSAAYSQPKQTRLNNNSSPASSVTNKTQVYSKSENISIDTKFKTNFPIYTKHRLQALYMSFQALYMSFQALYMSFQAFYM